MHSKSTKPMCVPLRSEWRLCCCCLWCGIVSTVSPLVYICSSITGILCTPLYIYALPTIFSHSGHSRSQGELWSTWDITQSIEPSLHFVLCGYKWIRGLGCPSLRLSIYYLFMTFYLACCISADGFVCLRNNLAIYLREQFFFPTWYLVLNFSFYQNVDLDRVFFWRS